MGQTEEYSADISAVEKVIDAGLAFYPDTFDKQEAKRRLVEVYKRIFKEIEVERDRIINDLIAERIAIKMKRQQRKGLAKRFKLS